MTFLAVCFDASAGQPAVSARKNNTGHMRRLLILQPGECPRRGGDRGRRLTRAVTPVMKATPSACAAVLLIDAGGGHFF